jgi:serine/threonine protein kinase/Flp pilus assembly protein TadD
MNQTGNGCREERTPLTNTAGSLGPGPDDPRVIAALEEYLAAMKAGRAPKREDFLARHVEIAAVLNECLEGLEWIRGGPASQQSSVASADGPAAAGIQPGASLGDYQIVREVGRGGMGVVYEAVQMSLGRRVALKVLPFATALDAKHLQRFKNEAQAAAQLHHTNIVPVFGVGCERSVHYYAMQFIDGQTLAALIEELRQNDKCRSTNDEGMPNAEIRNPNDPPRNAVQDTQALRHSTFDILSTFDIRHSSFFRTVANLGSQAAQALEHAHQLGVVHRDIKPGNLLLETAPPAASGTRGAWHQELRLWITDFGLAQMHSQTGLTVTGDLVGTLRYMSPEQALGKRARVDHRTDIYSLGATLYELLALDPAFPGRDREELLRQIAFEEPKPLRRLNRAVPHELETIVHKAMAKDPDERYASAQELADDLERFRKDEPIRARRPTLVQRARRWARRHAAAMRAATLSLLAVFLVLAASVGWVAGERAARHAETEQAVRQVLDEAEVWQRQQRVPEAVAAARRAAWLAETGSADESLHRVVQERLADLELLAQLQEARLAMSAVKDGRFDANLGDRLYAGVFHAVGLDLDQLAPADAAERLGESSVAVELAAVLDHWALLRRGSRPSPDPGWKHLLSVARAIDRDPWRDRVRQAVAKRDKKVLEELAAQALQELVAQTSEARQPLLTLLVLGQALALSGAVDRAEALLRQVRRHHPGDFWANQDLATVLVFGQPPRPQEALAYYQATVALRPDSPGAHNNVGFVLIELGRLDDALVELREAIRLKKDNAPSHLLHGDILFSRGRLDEAIAAYREAIRCNPDFAEAHLNLGTALGGQRRWDEAIKEYQTALRLQKDYPRAHFNLGVTWAAKGRLDKAIAEYHEALRQKKDYAEVYYNLGNALYYQRRLDEAADAYRAASRYNKDLPEPHYNLGVILQGKGRLDEAIVEFGEAIRLKKDLLNAHYNRALALKARGRLDEAVTAYRAVLRLNPNHANAHYNLANTLAQQGQLPEAVNEYREAVRINKAAASAYYGLGIALQGLERLDEAIAAYRETLRLNKNHAQAHCNLGQVYLARGEFANALPYLKQGHALGSKQAGWPYPSAEWVRQCERMIELEPKFPLVLKRKLDPPAAERIEFADMAYVKRLYAFAARLYREALAAEQALDQQRYPAARAAARAGCGQGEDDGTLDDMARADWRQQALQWLQAELAEGARKLPGAAAKVRAELAQALQQWQRDAALACVRDASALEKLPDVEQETWRLFWDQVEVLRKRAQARKS